MPPAVPPAVPPALPPAVVFRERAYAKLNLVLHVGRPRPDGLHPLCSLFASIGLHDDLSAGPAAPGAVDTVDCPELAGENLALAAVRSFRERTREPLPPLRLRIEKRIPVAAGLGGGSADAAAALRLVNRMAGSPLGLEALRELAAGLGSDVPSQVEPAHAIVQGTGELVERVVMPPLAVVLVPSEQGLATKDVYREFDRLARWRAGLDPRPLRALAAAGPAGLAAGLDNDLQPAALSLRPELDETLARLRDSGAAGVAVSGSGPTCFGLFHDRGIAERAAGAIPGAILSALR